MGSKKGRRLALGLMLVIEWFFVCFLVVVLLCIFVFGMCGFVLKDNEILLFVFETMILLFF